jgi:hypothetical protein
MPPAIAFWQVACGLPTMPYSTYVRFPNNAERSYTEKWKLEKSALRLCAPWSGFDPPQFDLPHSLFCKITKFLRDPGEPSCANCEFASAGPAR